MNAPRVPAGRLRIGLAVAATLLASACAAGQQAQTANEKPTLDGTNADAGAIALRAIAVKPPTTAAAYKPGDDAPIRIVLVNNGAKDDTLTSLRSSAASGWASYNTTPPASATASVATPSATAPATTPSSPTTTSTASATLSSSPVAAHRHARGPKAQHSVKIPAGSRVSFGVPETQKVLLLTGLKQSLSPGDSIYITFTFANNGAVTVDVPVALTATPPEATVKPAVG